MYVCVFYKDALVKDLLGTRRPNRFYTVDLEIDHLLF